MSTKISISTEELSASSTELRNCAEEIFDGFNNARSILNKLMNEWEAPDKDALYERFYDNAPSIMRAYETLMEIANTLKSNAQAMSMSDAELISKLFS